LITLVASATSHQPGRAQYPRQISQPHGSDGGYFLDKSVFGIIYKPLSRIDGLIFNIIFHEKIIQTDIKNQSDLME
jgi:hypothetical protein